MIQGIWSEVCRFLIVGVINTIATYAIYLALLTIFSYTLSYTVAYLAGIAIAYLLNTAFVFKVDRDIAGAILFPLTYVAQYVIGIAVLKLMVETYGVDPRFALLFAIVVSVPVTFVLSRLILKHRTREPSGSTQK